MIKNYLEEIRLVIQENKSQSQELLIDKLSYLSRQWWAKLFRNLLPLHLSYFARPFNPSGVLRYALNKKGHRRAQQAREKCKSVGPFLPMHLRTPGFAFFLATNPLHLLTLPFFLATHKKKQLQRKVAQGTNLTCLAPSFLPTLSLHTPLSKKRTVNILGKKRRSKKCASNLKIINTKSFGARETKTNRYVFNFFLKEASNYSDSIIFKMLWKWAYRKHPNKSNRWIIKEYFYKINGRNRVFAVQSKHLHLSLSKLLFLKRVGNFSSFGLLFNSFLHAPISSSPPCPKSEGKRSVFRRAPKKLRSPSWRGATHRGGGGPQDNRAAAAVAAGYPARGKAQTYALPRTLFPYSAPKAAPFHAMHRRRRVGEMHTTWRKAGAQLCSALRRSRRGSVHTPLPFSPTGGAWKAHSYFPVGEPESTLGAPPLLFMPQRGKKGHGKAQRRRVGERRRELRTERTWKAPSSPLFLTKGGKGDQKKLLRPKLPIQNFLNSKMHVFNYVVALSKFNRFISITTHKEISIILNKKITKKYSHYDGNFLYLSYRKITRGRGCV